LVEVPKKARRTLLWVRKIARYWGMRQVKLLPKTFGAGEGSELAENGKQDNQRTGGKSTKKGGKHHNFLKVKNLGGAQRGATDFRGEPKLHRSGAVRYYRKRGFGTKNQDNTQSMQIVSRLGKEAAVGDILSIV